MIAWDGSAAVLAALRAVIPWLKLATAVRHFVVEDGGEGMPAEAAATYLSRYDIHAEIKRVADMEQKPDVLSLEAWAAHGASYCVMGAFGQGRLSEAVFGGVSRRVLDAAQLPLVVGRRRQAGP